MRTRRIEHKKTAERGAWTKGLVNACIRKKKTRGTAAEGIPKAVSAGFGVSRGLIIRAF